MTKLSFDTKKTVDCCRLCPDAILAIHGLAICSHNDVIDYKTSRALFEENCEELTGSCPAIKRQLQILEDYGDAD